MITDAKDVAILDGFTLNSLSAELDAVGGAHVHHIEVAARKLDEGMLTRDIGVSNR